MAPYVSSARVTVDGKFFRVGTEKFYIKGITYGPFAPDKEGCTFATPEQTRKDFERIRELGANVLRVYYVPPRWLLDIAQHFGLKIFVDVPWQKHRCFMDSRELQAEARQMVRNAVTQCKDHPAVFAYSVVNEISPEIIRWSTPERVSAFIDELVEEAKAVDPECLCTFTSYPPTEFLQARAVDFLCFNVYLHNQQAYDNYLARLQSLAGEKPLMLGEFGLDSYREGEEHKSEVLSWQIESAFRAGLSGIIIFSFTDDWYRGGFQIEDWAFGLTTRDRQPKASFQAVRKQFEIAPYFPLPRYPKVSVVVATYNGARNIKTCLTALQKLNYPNYEVIVIDDGSKDATPEIVACFPDVRCVRQENRGLSAARNAGINAATGEIVAFTDDDCRPDEDWLFYIIGDLLRTNYAAIGGHNFLPPEDSWVAAAVMASPGGPAHVMMTDHEAEHIPGCNMVWYKWALESIGGFDPIYRKAGDDVDVCWRLQQAGHKIGFSHSGFVWHYRRSTVRAYLKQQEGYGEAEALLIPKHPEYFNSLGSGLWKGRIYSNAKFGVVLGRSVIYHGLFGSAFFQKLYTPDPSLPLMLCTSLEYYIVVCLPLLIASSISSFALPLAALSIAVPVVTCCIAAAQAELPKAKRRFWSKPLIALLFFLQPIYRGWARYKSRWVQGTKSPGSSLARGQNPSDEVTYWAEKGADRHEFLGTVIAELSKRTLQYRCDNGWSKYDLELTANAWTRVRLITATEDLHAGARTVRCRLDIGWSLRAKILFALALGINLAAVLLLREKQPWIWMLPMSLSVYIWVVQMQGWNLQRILGGFLALAADQHQLQLVKGKK
jgi:glycosyltransferase involved in cell wall biosynthesis